MRALGRREALARAEDDAAAPRSAGPLVWTVWCLYLLPYALAFVFAWPLFQPFCADVFGWMMAAFWERRWLPLALSAPVLLLAAWLEARGRQLGVPTRFVLAAGGAYVVAITAVAYAGDPGAARAEVCRATRRLCTNETL